MSFFWLRGGLSGVLIEHERNLLVRQLSSGLLPALARLLSLFREVPVTESKICEYGLLGVHKSYTDGKVWTDRCDLPEFRRFLDLRLKC
jgi:hypothetical protein